MALHDVKVDPVRFAETLDTRGVGFIHDLYPDPVLANDLQKTIIASSRLGIPNCTLNSSIRFTEA